MNNKCEPQIRQLTTRLKEILILVARGNGNKDIGKILCIGERTVKNHMTTIMQSLQALDRAHAVVLALTMGELELTGDNDLVRAVDLSPKMIPLNSSDLVQ